MLIEKFKYVTCPRENVNGQRLYATPTGRLPSVTTILSKTEPPEKKEGLEKWRKAVGHKKAQEITTEAANRGTKMHTYLEEFIKTDTLRERGTNPFGWASHAMAEQVITSGLKNVNEVWGVEVPLYYPEVYAGTTDGAGLHLGTEAILDYKQTNKPKKREWIGDYFIQLAAYAEAHNAIHGTKIQKGVILMCVRPTVDKGGNILSVPEYQEFIIEGEEFEKWRVEWWKRVETYYMLNT